MPFLSDTGSMNLRLPTLVALAALVMLTASLGGCADATPSTSTLPPANGPPSMAGKSAEERLQALRALSRASKATTYYPGDPYTGMSIVSIDTADLAGNGAYAMKIRYATESSDRSMIVTIYTADQYARAHVEPTGPPVTIMPYRPSDFIIGPFGVPRHNILRSQRPGAVIVVSGNPSMGVGQLTDVADHLRPVTD